MNNDKWPMGSDSHILSCVRADGSTPEYTHTHTHALAHRHTFHRVLYMTSFIGMREVY